MNVSSFLAYMCCCGGGSDDKKAYESLPGGETKLKDILAAKVVNLYELHAFVQDNNLYNNSLNEQGDRALHLMVRNFSGSKTAIYYIELLLQSGADPKIKNKEGKTPYELAYDLGREECCKKLQGDGKSLSIQK